MRKRTFKGTYYEIGQQRAKYLQTLKLPPSTPQEVTFSWQCYKAVEAIYPAILDEFKGLLEGSNFDEDDFLTYFFARQEGLTGGCTAFVGLPSITEDGCTIVGRNYDWVYSDHRWCELRFTHPEGTYPTYSYTHHWAGSPDVLNGQGLFVAMSSLPKQVAQRPGLQWNLVIDIMMATCQNVQQAIRFMQEVVHLRAMNYLIADAQGDAVVIQALPEAVTVRKPKQGYVIATNHRVDEAGHAVGTASERSQARYHYVKRMIEAHRPKISQADIEHLLQDHEGGICNGVHSDYDTPGERGDQWGTIWSLIAKPHQRALWVAPGHPCKTLYEKVA
jgi:predicted choloylglycine hydrolase